jgi:hypothetical protein
MPVNGDIQYLQRHQLDDSKWNRCLDAAPNGLIYSYTHYLDAMCDNWDALVLGDYKVVMPLPWRQKGGVHYLYQPFLTAQLGLSGNGLNAELLRQFFAAVPKKFRYWDISLNHGNLYAVEGYHLHMRSNYVLSLSASYQQLYKNYRENIRRNIKKSAGYGCVVTTGIEVERIIALTRQQAAQIPEADFQNFVRLYNLLKEKGQAKTYGVLSGSGELLASCVFFFSHQRAFYILVGNHPNGRTLGASHALIDAFIKDHAGSDLLLDFEGSDIRNLAFFYSSFGAVEEKYAAIKLNRLPWWMKWLKK